MAVLDNILKGLPLITYERYMSEGIQQDQEAGVPFYLRTLKATMHAAYGLIGTLWATGFILTREVNPVNQWDAIQEVLRNESNRQSIERQKQEIYNSLELRINLRPAVYIVPAEEDQKIKPLQEV